MNAMIGPQWHLELSHRNIQNSSDLLPILGIIETASLNLSNLDTMTLSDVVTELKARSEQKNTGRSFRIQTPAGTYVVDTGRIKALIMRSGIAATMDGYRTLSSASNDWKRILFGRTASYRSVNLNAQPNDNSIFAGRSEIPGFFSVAAFNDRVVPLSTELPKILDKLIVVKAVIERFQDFVLATLTAYAADYARVYQDYFQAHRTREFSPQVLPYAASQMESSTSPILTLVKQMRDGTSFPIQRIMIIFCLLKTSKIGMHLLAMSSATMRRRARPGRRMRIWWAMLRLESQADVATLPKNRCVS